MRKFNNTVVYLNVGGGGGGNNRDGFIDSTDDHRNPPLDPNHNGVLGSESCSVGKRIKLFIVSNQLVSFLFSFVLDFSFFKI
ncbi:hypothetical protein U1Q18_035714 [Sarracenia purpurea var. burkii]